MATQDLIWNAYIDKYNAEPSNDAQLLAFSKNKDSNTTVLSFSVARKVYDRNKGKGKIETGSNTSSVNAQPNSASTVSNVDEEEKGAVIQQKETPKDKLTETDIDHILNEIEENEVKIAQNDGINNDAITDWDSLLRELGIGNIQYIKNLISSNDIDINAQNPQNGMTLLMYSVIIGNIELIKALCNFGASVHIQDHDGDDVLKYAIKYGRYKITELLYYRTLSGRLGSDLKDIAIQIHTKNKEAAFMMNNEFKMGDFMMKAMEQRAPFGDDMLFYAWYFILNGYNEQESTKNDDFHHESRYFTPSNNSKVEPLQSKLFQTMMKTYESIISNTSDKDGWKWLRENFINSLIWYLPHPVYGKTDTNTDEKDAHNDNGDDVVDDIEKILKKTLFYELLTRVRAESKKQSDLLLNEKINKIKLENKDEWNQLTTYNVVTQHSKSARQDKCGCLQPQYTEDDLSEEIYPSSIHFSAQKHYDKNIYLNELLFYGNIMDKRFQKDMKQMTKEINAEIGENVLYSAGPVKTLIRSQAKVENDYINEDFPSSARILDINRCALHCDDVSSMMKFIETFVNRIKTKKGYSVIDIIRCKNGWNIYDVKYPQYTDIKLNVLVETMTNNKKQMIIAEVQLLLELMSDFKRKAHKLYSIERKFELVYNFGTLTAAMQSFEDYSQINDILLGIIDSDDIKQFKLFWITSHCNVNALFPNGDSFNKEVHKTVLFRILCNINSNINRYFVNECSDGCIEAILVYMDKYIKIYNFGTFWLRLADSSYVKHHESPDHLSISFLDQLFDLMDVSNLKKFFFVDNYTTTLNAICTGPRQFKRTLHYLLNTPKLEDSIRRELLFGDNNTFTDAFLPNRIADNMITILKYIQNDRTLLRSALSARFDSLWESDAINIMMRICASKDPFSIKALRLLFCNELITEDEKFNGLKHADANGTTMHYALGNKNIYNGLYIMDYYNKTDKTRLMELLLLQNKKGDAALSVAEDFRVFRSVFHYFKDDGLKRLLSAQNKEGRSVFGKICQEVHSKVLIRFILYSETLSLTKKDKYELLSTPDNNGFIPLMYCPDIMCIEMLKYVQNDKEMLLKLLSIGNKDKRTVLMFLEIGRGTTRPNILTLDFVLNSETLDDADKYDLLSQQDINGKSVLYHTATLCDESEEDKMAPLKIMEYLKRDEQILKNVLLQKSNDGDTFLMPIATGDRCTAPMLRSLRSIKDRNIISELLQSKNNKDETVYLAACNAPHKAQKALIEHWLDVLNFEKDINDEKNEVDFSFVEKKTDEKQKSITSKCICGLPLRLNNAMVLNRTQRMVNCNRCNRTERGQVYACQNKGYFVLNGRRTQHQTAYVVCMQCVRQEIAEIRAAEAKAKASDGSEDYKTNPFIGCCRFLQYDLCKRLLDRIGDNKELMMSLLTSTHGNLYNKTTPIHYICHHKDETLGAKMLQLLVLDNKLLTDGDKLKIMTQRNGYQVSALGQANVLCGIEIVKYFKKDKDMLLELISPHESQGHPALLYMCDDVRVEVLECFKDDRECLLKLFSFQHSSGRKLLGQMCCSKENEIKTLRFILQCNALSYEDKMSLFEEKFGSDNTPFSAACDKEDHFAEKEIVYYVLEYIQKDREKLLLFLNREMNQKTALMSLCENTDDWSVKAVALIMNNAALTAEDKLKLLLKKNRAEFVVDGHVVVDIFKLHDSTALQIACQNRNRAEFVVEIFKCFANDKESLIKLLSHYQGLLFSVRFGQDTQRLRTVLNVIDGLEDTLQWKLLSDTNASSKKQTFLYRMDKIKTLFGCIHNEDILERLVNMKDNEYQNVLDHMKEQCQSGKSNDERINAKCIVDFMDYLKMKKTNVFDDTNVFITCCYLGKYDMIKRMVKYAGNDAERIKSLFMNNYDEDGHNCLMLLAMNGHFKVLMDVLDGVLNLIPALKLELLSDQNMFSGENVVLNLCKNGHFDVIQSILKNINDDTVAFKLLSAKDNDNKSCFDFVEANHFIHKYKV